MGDDPEGPHNRETGGSESEEAEAEAGGMQFKDGGRAVSQGTRVPPRSWTRRGTGLEVPEGPADASISAQ